MAVFSTSKIKYLDMFGAALYINIHYYSCPHCNATYVGESSRHFHTRISEHRDISPRGVNLQELIGLMEKPRIVISMSIFLKQTIVSSNFSIIFSANYTSINLAESIFIHKCLLLLMELYIPPLFIF